MRKLLLIILSFIGLIFISCAKENQTINEQVKTQVEIRHNIIIYQACWTDWGRARWNCHRWGLCNYTDCWIWNKDAPCCPISETNAELIVDVSSTNSTATLKIYLTLNSQEEINAYNHTRPKRFEKVT